MMKIFDPSACELGEGALWHPLRQSLFWFDINAMRFFEHNGETRHLQFDEHFSAAGWIDHGRLLMASETGLWDFNVETGAAKLVIEIESDNPATRSNDGRADPFGGFWIGTMGKKMEAGAGAIYRYFKGEIHKVYDQLTIPNSICFSPDLRWVYFTDTAEKIIWRDGLAFDGIPQNQREVFIDLSAEELNPDGAVIDAEGNLWNAQWGASRVACYSAEGQFIRAVDVPSPHVTCPAFGGEELTTLFVTTAREGLAADQLDGAGHVYSVDLGVKGLPEHQVIL